MARTIRRPSFSSRNHSNRIRNGKHFAGRNRVARYANRLDLASRIADFVADEAGALVVPPAVVPTFVVFRYGKEFDRLVAEGLTPIDNYCGAGQFRVTARHLRVDDLVDHGYTKWCERNEYFDSIDGEYEGAEAQLALHRAEYNRLTGESLS